jgi:hypothetical protein
MIEFWTAALNSVDPNTDVAECCRRALHFAEELQAHEDDESSCGQIEAAQDLLDDAEAEAWDCAFASGNG